MPRNTPETIPESDAPNNKGGGNADIHPGPGLSRVPQKRASGYSAARGMAMTEVATSLLALLSVGIFAAHALDAYRTR